MTTNDFETEMKLSFLEEATQLLGDAEQCFLSLESKSDDPSLLDKLFRLAHNLKGSAKAVGFGQMAEFTHELESLLLKLKKGELPVSSGIVSLMLRCKDHLETMVETLKRDHGASVEDEALLKDVKTAQVLDGNTAPQASPVVAPPVASGPTAAPLVAAPLAPSPEAEASARPLNWSQTPKTQAKETQSADESIRVSLGRVEKLVNFVGELVILQTVLQEQSNRKEPLLLERTINELSKVTKEIQSISMGLRMIPLKQTFQKMQRIVRDTSQALGKKVELKLSGEDTELDKTVLENINDPLVHLVRNAVDHGIESADARARAGKPESGTIRLSAYQQADRIVIEVQDDGGGLDPERLRKKAIEKGVLSESEQLTEQQAYQLIFKPGFSTKTEVTDISGRGVGLDVVKTNVESVLQGEVQVISSLGSGTTFRISLPLTLAIADGMIVKLGEERYVIPLAQVHETIRPAEGSVYPITGMGEVLNLRGETLPLYPLRSLLKRATKSAAPALGDCIAIIVRSATKSFGVLVDDIMGKQQVVIKRLGPEVRDMPGFSGSAILGDGCPGVILDLPALVTQPKASSKPISKQKGAVA